MPALAAVLVSLVVGLASGGRARNLAAFRLRFEVAVLALFVVQAVARGRFFGITPPTNWGLAVWVGSSAALAGLMAANRRIPGMALGALGLLLNVDIVLANGAMPAQVSSLGVARSTASLAALTHSGGFYRAADASTVLKWLGDALPLRVSGAGLLLSVGDIAIAVAVITVIVYAMAAGAEG